MSNREVTPFRQPLSLKMSLPGSKSITHRALLCAALAEGKSKIQGISPSDDVKVMLMALRKLGVKIKKMKEGFEIEGVRGKFKKRKMTLDCGGSGVAARFLMALMILREGETIITGNQSLQKRPMTDLVEALRQLGARIEYLEVAGFLPIRVVFVGAQNSVHLQIQHSVVVRADKSSEYLSALLMLAPLLPHAVKIEVVGKVVSEPYIDMTLAVMKGFGVQIRKKTDVVGTDVIHHVLFDVKPKTYKPTNYRVEGDATAATYFSALNFLHGGHLIFENLNYSKSIQGDVNFPKTLKQLTVGRSRMIDMSLMPDAAMTLAICALFGRGKTTITGLSTLRFKETNRLAALERELKKIGAGVTIGKDWIEIVAFAKPKSIRNPSEIHPKSIRTYNDHRMAMCFAILGTKIPGLIIQDPDCVNKTYPDFWKDLERAYLSPVKLGTKNLVLIGMRGSGKTTLGKKIAKKLGRKFVDIDAEIEKMEGMKISDIVGMPRGTSVNGWPYFRSIEQNFCSSLSDTKNLIISTGGGVILDPKKMKSLKKNSVIVFLFADPQVLCERVKGGRKRPPLTDKTLKDEMNQVWQERRDLYLKYADVVWDVTNGSELELFVET